MFLLLLFLSFAEAEWRADELEIFNPLLQNFMTSRTVVVSETGRVYILHFEDRVIVRLDEDGTRLPDLGGKGQGPGEFGGFVGGIDVIDGVIYAVENYGKRIHRFNEGDGAVMGSVSFKGFGTAPRRTAAGWAVLDLGIFGDSRGPSGALFDDEWSLRTEAVTWPKELSSYETGQINPAPETAQMAVTLNGERVFFYVPETRVVLGFDAGTHEKVITIDPKFTPVPFDEDWGKQRYKEMKKTRRQRGPRGNASIKPVYPDFFPRISRLETGPAGNLWIYPGTHIAYEHARPKIFEPFSGKETTSPVPYAFRYRVLAIRGDHAYVSLFHDEQGAGVARVRRDNLVAFLRANPLAE
ncbi:MAG: hypothetical protein QNK37_19460 [Acidobacteriota bacterium]|nr:hypothetical protein [Acidobacteriota bacterium]